MSPPTYAGGATKNQQPEPKPEPVRYRPTSASPCCAQAVRKNCVCVARWACPVHGDHCYGSHE